MGYVATADSGLATVRVVFAELAYLSGRDARKHHAVIENVHSGSLGQRARIGDDTSRPERSRRLGLCRWFGRRFLPVRSPP